MSYIDGFVIAVPDANRDAFIEHALAFDRMLIAQGALRVMECWGDSVADGKITDFRRAVLAEESESVIFSWVEWPDKETRDAAHAAFAGQMEEGTLDPSLPAMPFDGKRMIFGGFEPVVDLGAAQ